MPRYTMTWRSHRVRSCTVTLDKEASSRSVFVLSKNTILAPRGLGVPPAPLDPRGRRANRRKRFASAGRCAVLGSNDEDAPFQFEAAQTIRTTTSQLIMVVMEISCDKPHAKEYTFRVRVQSLVAGLLSAFLLAVSSWSSACDLSCSLRQFHSNCETQGVASPGERVAESDSSDMAMPHDMVMPRENGDHMAMAELDAKAAIHLVATTCTHQACDQGLSLASVNAGKDHTQLQGVQSVAVVAVHAPILSLRIRAVEPQGVPLPLGPVNPLSVSLRI